MNKRIRMMIDELFAGMKMTAENLALRDELMANAEARYDDALCQGRSEMEAFNEVAESLSDVQALLKGMNAEDAQEAPAAPEEPQTAQQEADQAEKTGSAGTDLGDALNKAFAALGGFGQAIIPEAKKLVREADSASGGMLTKIGRATKKGLSDVQKAAGEAIDKFSGDKGEIVFDFGPKGEGAPADDAASAPEGEPDESAVDGQEAAESEPLTGADGAVDEEALARAVEEMAREAEAAVNQAKRAEQDAAKSEDYTVRDAEEPVSGALRFPAAGLHAVDIRVDADDVEITWADGHEIEILWDAKNADCEPIAAMEGHTLTIRRKNPDVFKTFFSVFAKEGGRITVRVPKGYAAAYAVTTTSGDIRIAGVDVGDVKAHSTSGRVRVEPDTGRRAEKIDVKTVSGHTSVSACAECVAVTTVSGNQMISCNAQKADINVVSGRVHAEGVCDEWEISAVSGDVELICSAAPAKKVEISAMNSTVRLALPGDIRGFAAQVSGPLGCEIVNEFGPDRYGTCALPIRMETMRGKLMITRL